jgi:hypothetical protein
LFDHGFQGGEAEGTDQQGQAELGTTEPDQAAQNADACTTDECTDAAFLCGLRTCGSHRDILPLFPMEWHCRSVFRRSGRA